jgi:2-dehydropantoate 2-reductase
MMKVIIFGTGAMACLFGARLSARAHVTLVGTWIEGIEAIRQRGILFEDSEGPRTIQVGAEYLSMQHAPADLAIILVKSWQTEQIAEHVPACLKAGGIAISLQNGLGNLELLGSRVFPGVTSEGATLLGPAHVRPGGSGPTHVAAPAWVAEVFASGGFDCRRCSPDAAAGLLWGKLSVSCGINALTALLRIPNGELLNRPDASNLMVRAAVECAGVARTRGIELPFDDPEAQVREVAARTAANQSSMLQDLQRGAPTECDAINGAVVREAGKVGITAPINEVLWRLVRTASHQDRSEIG